jgi:hypothetical protein
MTAALQQARARRPARCDLAANVPELVQSPLTRGDRNATGARPERDRSAAEEVPRSAAGATWGSGGSPAKRRRRDVGQRRKSREAPPARRGAAEEIPRSAAGATWGGDASISLEIPSPIFSNPSAAAERAVHPRQKTFSRPHPLARCWKTSHFPRSPHTGHEVLHTAAPESV